MSLMLFESIMSELLTLLAPTPQNGQTLKQFVWNLQTICLSVFDNFVGQTLKGLIKNLSAYNFHDEAVLLHTLTNLNPGHYPKILRSHMAHLGEPI